MMTVAVALVHYPVYNKTKEIITSALVSLDIHDIARCCRTYDVPYFYIIQPIEQQRILAEKLIRHWTEGYGSVYNADRKTALHLVKVYDTLETLLAELQQRYKKIYSVATSALAYPKALTFEAARAKLFNESEDSLLLLLFGTGSGLSENLIKNSDYALTPVQASGMYNHLSVRAAVAIVLDRFFGERT